jgi:hypothetical protein
MKLGDCPNPKWRMWQNKIIMGCFTDPTVKYLKDCLWEGYSKIDGTNSKICYFPSTTDLLVGGKTDKANSQHGQFEMLQEIGGNIKPELEKLFPKEGAKFAPVKDGNKILFYIAEADDDLKVKYWEEEKAIAVLGKKKDPNYSSIKMEEVPVYIYGEYYGQGIQKCGGRYHDHNDFRVFDIDAQGWWVPSDIRDAWCKQLGLKTVPFIGIRTIPEFEKMVMDGFTTLVDGVKDPTLIEEGIVARPVIPIKDARGNRIIVKIKYCDYKEWAETRKQFTDEEYNEFLEWYKNNIEPID